MRESAGLRIVTDADLLEDTDDLDVPDEAPKEWRKVEGFERYSVSSYGRVRNDETGFTLKPFARGFEDRYLGVDLYRDGKRHPRKVHRLVAEAFLPPGREDQTEVNHWDTDTLNNRADNLEWCSRLENEAHKEFMRATEVFERHMDDPEFAEIEA